jgi:YVTN family beta-propeller protein
VPDRAAREKEIYASPARLAQFIAIREVVGEGHDQLVDDVFSSTDGRLAFISRPSFADVVAVSLRTKKIVWRRRVDGYRADHMAISPDGKTLLVSASTAKVVEVLDTATGKLTGRIPSGDQPHESNYSADGKLIYHASIGTVYTPLDEPAFDSTKGERIFEIIDAKTNKVLRRWDIGKILKTFGYPGMSSAVRPMAISRDEKTAYFQLSFFHGFVVFDLVNGKPVRLVNLPIPPKAAALPRTSYVNDSAHHGLAIDRSGQALCVAGTMSDYIAVVGTTDYAATIASHGAKPYWASTTIDGEHCVVSYSGDDSLAIIDYRTKKEVASIPVGDHPQRVRNAVIRRSYLG